MLIVVPLCPAISYVIPRVTLLVLIPPAIFALFRYSPGDPYVHPLSPVRFEGGMMRGEEGSTGSPSRKSIYLFIYVPRGGLGPTRGCEARLIAGTCIEPGIPRERPYGMRGNGKSHGELARGYSTPSPGLSGSSLGIYGVFTYSHVYAQYDASCSKYEKRRVSSVRI